MPKRAASTTLEAPLYDRVAKVAGVDKRSVSQIIETCVERAIAELETEIEEKEKRRHPKHKDSSGRSMRTVGQTIQKLSEAHE